MLLSSRDASLGLQKGFVSVLSAGTVGNRVHSGMLEAFEVRDKEEILDLQNLDSRVIGFNANNQSIVDGILKPWVECCRDQVSITQASRHSSM